MAKPVVSELAKDLYARLPDRFVEVLHDYLTFASPYEIARFTEALTTEIEEGNRSVTDDVRDEIRATMN